MINKLPPVTIGIPMYNCAPYIGGAIRSVFAQTHRSWELLLVDDGSTDETLKIAQSVSDPRVKVISDGRNRGLPARLNQIAREANYDFVARMDGDDLIAPERLVTQLRILIDQPETSVVGTGTYSMTADELLRGARGINAKGAIPLSEVLAGRVPLVHASCVYRRDWIRRNPYDETVARSEDFELWARAAAANDLQVCTVAEPLYIYREDLNISQKKLYGAYAFELQLVDQYLNGLEKLKARARVFCKILAVKAMVLPPVSEMLLRRRNPAVPDEVMEADFARILAKVYETSVPRMLN